MARRPREKTNHPDFDRALQGVLNGENNPPLVVKSIRDKRTREVVRVRQHVETIKDTVIRIQQQCDPIGFLMNVVNGAAFEEAVLTEMPDGQIMQQSAYVTPTLKQRVEAARFLAHKVLPSMSVQKHIVENQEVDPNFKPGDPGQPSFATIVQAAANEAQKQAVKMAPPKIAYEVPEDDAEHAWADSAGDSGL